METKFEFYYDDNHDEVLTLVSDNKWADFRKIDDTGVYKVKAFGPVSQNAGTANTHTVTTLSMENLFAVLDTLKRNWPQVIVRDNNTLFFDEECKTIIKLRDGFTIC